jgi:hypothetical protein
MNSISDNYAITTSPPSKRQQMERTYTPLRLPVSTKREYRAACKRHKRSMNTQTELLIEEWLKTQKP